VGFYGAFAVEAQISICMEYMVNRKRNLKKQFFELMLFSGWWFIRFNYEESYAYSRTYSW
jgi:hypothetical protein